MKAKEIKIGTTKVLVSVDTKNKRIHILDLDDGMSLTNALSEKFCQKVLVEAGLYRPESSYDFICYHTDNMMSVFNPETSNFEFLPSDDERVDEEMKKEMFYLYG